MHPPIKVDSGRGVAHERRKRDDLPEPLASAFTPLEVAPLGCAHRLGADMGPVAPGSLPTPRPPPSMEDVLPALVRKVGWTGDGRRAAIRLELGAGALAGATLVVQAEGGRVHVRLSDAPEAELDAWSERIAARLAARGLDVVGVERG